MSRVLAPAFALALLAPLAASAQCPVEVSPEYYKILLENDAVRVLEMRLPAGAQDAQHSHPSEVVHFVNGGSVTVTLPDGTEVEKDLAPGEIMYSGPWTHRVKNRGESELHAIIVELKPPSAASGE
jgi:quercetin dioxygenase-like cupin family protein